MEQKNWQYLQTSRDGRTLTVRFNSKGRLNCLNHAVMRELTELARALQADSELSAVVLTGTPEMFSAGMDLKDPQLAAAREATVAEKRVLLRAGPYMCAAWEALEQVTIVAMEGWCVGGALALAVACDWRVASVDTQLSVPELKLGMNMSWQSVPRFVNLIGPSRSKQLLLLAEPLGADEAERWGLLDYLTPAGAALERALQLAGQVAGMPPVPTRMIKKAVNTSANVLNEATSFMDADQFLLTQTMGDAGEGARAFFEGGKGKFEGN